MPLLARARWLIRPSRRQLMDRSRSPSTIAQKSVGASMTTRRCLTTIGMSLLQASQVKFPHTHSPLRVDHFPCQNSLSARLPAHAPIALLRSISSAATSAEFTPSTPGSGLLSLVVIKTFIPVASAPGEGRQMGYARGQVCGPRLVETVLLRRVNNSRNQAANRLVTRRALTFQSLSRVPSRLPDQSERTIP